jgi:hypothetical protein
MTAPIATTAAVPSKQGGATEEEHMPRDYDLSRSGRAPELYEIWPAGCFCGPAALAALTGCDAHKHARAWVNNCRQRRPNCPVMGMATVEMAAVLELLGIEFYQVRSEPGATPTVQAFVNGCARPGVFYILVTGRHFLAALDGYVADNVVRFGCLVAEHPSRRCRVKTRFEIESIRPDFPAPTASPIRRLPATASPLPRSHPPVFTFD